MAYCSVRIDTIFTLTNPKQNLIVLVAAKMEIRNESKNYFVQQTFYIKLFNEWRQSSYQRIRLLEILLLLSSVTRLGNFWHFSMSKFEICYKRNPDFHAILKTSPLRKNSWGYTLVKIWKKFGNFLFQSLVTHLLPKRLSVWPEKNRQMSIKVAQNGFF